MFKDTKAFSSFSVSDIQKAKEFYAETLGLNVSETPQGLELHIAGGIRIFIYPSSSNKPADFTILNFVVDDVEKAVEMLAKKGVHMEQYDTPTLKTNEKGIVVNDAGHGPRAMAWFKDPAGNVLSVLQEK